MTNERPLRRLVQQCFEQAADQLESNGERQEADQLREATVYWLKHINKKTLNIIL